MRKPLVLGLLAAALAASTGVNGTDAKGGSGALAAAQALQPLAEKDWDYAKARHLLCRAGFGAAPREVEKLLALGLHKAVDSLVDYRMQPDVEIPVPKPVEDAIADSALRKLAPEERQKAVQQKRRNDQLHFQRIREWWVRRMVESPRPLEEKLVLFWHGHFAAEYRTVRNSEAMYRQNQLFREHAVGNFGTLLHGIVHDAAMLRYLDNDRNVKGRPNENLAREIMELFAMGEGQGYSEQDIKEAARALTGFTFERESLNFRFARAAHDNGSKTVFGKTGDYDGDRLVELIFDQPAPPRFIARKLFVYFVHEEPDSATVEELAGVLRQNKYELAPFLKRLFSSQEFYSTRALGTQIKSPVQLVVGTLRTLDIKQYEPAALLQAMRIMGQELMEPPNVKGWEGGRAWINTNTLLARDNFAAMLVGRSLEGGAARIAQNKPPAKPAAKGERPIGPLARQLDFIAPLQERKLATPAAIVDYYAQALLATALPDGKRVELIAFLGNLPPASEWNERPRELNAKLAGLLVLMMSLPEYQMT